MHFNLQALVENKLETVEEELFPGSHFCAISKYGPYPDKNNV